MINERGLNGAAYTNERSIYPPMTPIPKSQVDTSESFLTRLFANMGTLIFAATVPTLVLTAYFISSMGDLLRSNREQEMTELMRGVSVAVDAELLQVTQFVSALAASEGVRLGNFATLDNGLRRIIATIPSITVVHILDLATNRYIVHSDFPPGTQLDASPNAIEQAQRVAASGKTIIFGIHPSGPTVERPFIPIRTPVFRDGKVSHVITAGISAEHLSKIFTRVNFDPLLTGAIIDADLRIAARSRAADQFAGRHVNEPLAKALNENKSGFFASINQEGAKLYSVFVRSPETGWASVAGIPPEFIDAPIKKSVFAMLATAAVAIGLGLALASFIAIKLRCIRAEERGLNYRLERMIEERSEELRASEERYRTIIEDQTEMIIRLDRTGKLTFANREFVTRFGLSTPRRLDEDFYQMIADADQAKTIEEIDDLFDRRGTINLVECKMGNSQGRVFWQNWTFRSIVDSISQRIVEVQGVGRDITDLRSAQDQLRQAQKMEAVGQLTGGLAHDFNNLLAVVRGNAEFLREKFGPNPMLAAIERAVMRGADLTQRLLSFSRRQEQRPRSIDPNEFLEKTSVLLKRTLGMEIDIVCHSSCNGWRIFADEGQLENAILNLAINSRDAMPGGGSLHIGAVDVSEDEARRWFAEGETITGDYIEISVRDTGCGIAPELLGHVYDPFFTTKEDAKGSGLGLAMVHDFVRLSGGAIRLESEPGRGTCVRLLLPCTTMEADRHNATRKLPPRGSGETILVIEDDNDVRAFVKLSLEDLGYVIIERADSNDASDILTSDQRIDLLLSDIRLPNGANGFELAKRFQLGRPASKVLLMSGYVDENMDFNAGFGMKLGVLKKPFHREELARRVKQAIYNEYATYA